MFSLSAIDDADEMKLDSTESLGRYLERWGFVVLSNSGRRVHRRLSGRHPADALVEPATPVHGRRAFLRREFVSLEPRH